MNSTLITVVGFSLVCLSPLVAYVFYRRFLRAILSDLCLIDTNSCASIQYWKYNNAVVVRFIPEGFYMFYDGQTAYVYQDVENPSNVCQTHKVCNPVFKVTTDDCVKVPAEQCGASYVDKTKDGLQYVCKIGTDGKCRKATNQDVDPQCIKIVNGNYRVPAAKMNTASTWQPQGNYCLEQPNRIIESFERAQTPTGFLYKQFNRNLGHRNHPTNRMGTIFFDGFDALKLLAERRLINLNPEYK